MFLTFKKSMYPEITEGKEQQTDKIKDITVKAKLVFKKNTKSTENF